MAATGVPKFPQTITRESGRWNAQLDQTSGTITIQGVVDGSQVEYVFASGELPPGDTLSITNFGPIKFMKGTYVPFMNREMGQVQSRIYWQYDTFSLKLYRDNIEHVDLYMLNLIYQTSKGKKTRMYIYNSDGSHTKHGVVMSFDVSQNMDIFGTGGIGVPVYFSDTETVVIALHPGEVGYTSPSHIPDQLRLGDGSYKNMEMLNATVWPAMKEETWAFTDPLKSNGYIEGGKFMITLPGLPERIGPYNVVTKMGKLTENILANDASIVMTDLNVDVNIEDLHLGPIPLKAIDIAGIKKYLTTARKNLIKKLTGFNNVHDGELSSEEEKIAQNWEIFFFVAENRLNDNPAVYLQPMYDLGQLELRDSTYTKFGLKTAPMTKGAR